ncbi:MAG: class I SAM-dependent methyltransferase [Methylocella sp.]
MSHISTSRLAETVRREAMDWGNNAAESYHRRAEEGMNYIWIKLIWPILSRHKIDFSDTIDFACGCGRNAKMLAAAGAAKVTLVDVNPDNIAYCREHVVPLGNFDVVQNNGYDLADLPSGRFTHLYSFDAMVHFDLEIVLAYVNEFARVIKPGGTAFIHHSNYTGNPGGNFRENPGLRNFMSAPIFKHASIRGGFGILEQELVSWSGPDSDCVTVLSRRSA